MSLQTILSKIEKLKIELDSYYPIPIDRLQKINYKFRLEWNYHSNFTPEEDTVQALNSLTNWLDNELKAIKKKKSKRTVPEIAFEYHLRFLTIHPFLDGNGRTGRILMNLILIAHGYPPIIIRTEEKELYGKYIAHAQQYEENPMPLYEMLGNVLIRSFGNEYLDNKEIEDIISALGSAATDELQEQLKSKIYGNNLTK